MGQDAMSILGLQPLGYGLGLQPLLFLTEGLKANHFAIARNTQP
jgi:hypothetical protein